MVIWKTIENCPNYKISNNGLVMSIKTGGLKFEYAEEIK